MLMEKEICSLTVCSSHARIYRYFSVCHHALFGVPFQPARQATIRQGAVSYCMVVVEEDELVGTVYYLYSIIAGFNCLMAWQ